MRQSTVLVVDDEKEIADFIELYLKNENYNEDIQQKIWIQTTEMLDPESS